MTILQAYLDEWTGENAGWRDVAATVAALAAAGARFANVLARGPLASPSKDADELNTLGTFANGVFRSALKAGPVSVIASACDPEPVRLQPGAALAVAIDPLNGANNLDSNAPVGTIFAIQRDVIGRDAIGRDGSDGTLCRDPGSAFRQPGTGLLAAGLVLYGAHTSLVLTLREGVQVFTLDLRAGAYRLTRGGVRIADGRREYAIDAASQRYWPWPFRAFIEDCVAGVDGPRGGDFNMHWLGCAAAEVFRILERGGVFMSPGDRRPGRERGCLGLVHQAQALALIAEQAGGAATDGFEPILALVPQDLRQRVPVVLGAREEVARITAHHTVRLPDCARPPLFAERGLLRS
jgi:fructose-1,6-bisphosphatase I